MFMHGRVICHITQRRWHLRRVWHNVSMIADSGCYASLRGGGGCLLTIWQSRCKVILSKSADSFSIYQVMIDCTPRLFRENTS